MSDVIDFYFWTVRGAWSLIVQNWILSFSILILVIGMIVQLVKDSRSR